MFKVREFLVELKSICSPAPHQLSARLPHDGREDPPGVLRGVRGKGGGTSHVPSDGDRIAPPSHTSPGPPGPAIGVCPHACPPAPHP